MKASLLITSVAARPPGKKSRSQRSISAMRFVPAKVRPPSDSMAPPGSEATMISVSRRRLNTVCGPVDFQILDAAGPIAAFEIATRYVEGAYELRVIAADGGLVRSSSGVAITAEAFDPGQRIDTLIVAGGEGSRAPALDGRVLGFVRQAAAIARRTTSVCSGAYI